MFGFTVEIRMSEERRAHGRKKVRSRVFRTSIVFARFPRRERNISNAFLNADVLEKTREKRQERMK